MTTPEQMIEDIAERVQIALQRYRADNPEIGNRLFHELCERAFDQLHGEAECAIDDIDEAYEDDQESPQREWWA